MIYMYELFLKNDLINLVQVQHLLINITTQSVASPRTPHLSMITIVTFTFELWPPKSIGFTPLVHHTQFGYIVRVPPLPPRRPLSKLNCWQIPIGYRYIELGSTNIKSTQPAYSVEKGRKIENTFYQPVQPCTRNLGQSFPRTIEIC